MTTGPALRAVFLRDTSTWVAPDFNPQIPGQALASQFRMMNGFPPRYLEYADLSGDVKTYTFFAKFDFFYTKNINFPSEDYIVPDQDKCAIITAEIAVEYTFSGDLLPSPEYLEHMANTSVLGQAWPYWREFCHSTQTRMGLPVTMVPLLLMRQDDRPIEPTSIDAPTLATAPPPKKRRRKE